MIEQARAGCDPLIVLPGPYYMTDFGLGEHFQEGSHEVFQTYNLVTEQVARATNCLFSDVYNAYGGAAWMVHYDGVHANDLGHRLVAHTIFQTLAQNCSGLAIRTKRLEHTGERWRDESTLMADYGYKGRRADASRNRRRCLATNRAFRGVFPVLQSPFDDADRLDLDAAGGGGGVLPAGRRPRCGVSGHCQ